MSGKAFLDTIGLGSRIAEPEGGDNVILRLSPAMIEPDPAQPRKVFDEESLRELAASLVRHGQLQPIRVRPAPCKGRYIVVAGERRWRAARLANLQKIDAVVVAERGDSDAVREAQVVENLQRAELTPLESAHAYRSLMGLWSCSQAELARRLGVGTATVSRALALLAAPDETRAAIAAGTSVRQATARPSKKRPAKADKRRAVELELPSGFVRVKRGATVEKLLEELRATIAEKSRAEAA
jgi:ParB family chromosome partitioning protein